MSHGDSENVRVPAPNGPPEGLRVSCRDHPLPAQHGCVTIGSQTNPSWLVTRSMENISRVSSLMFIFDANSGEGHSTHATRIRCLSSTSRDQVRMHGDTTHLIWMSCKYVNWYARIPHVQTILAVLHCLEAPSIAPPYVMPFPAAFLAFAVHSRKLNLIKLLFWPISFFLGKLCNSKPADAWGKTLDPDLCAQSTEESVKFLFCTPERSNCTHNVYANVACWMYINCIWSYMYAMYTLADVQGIHSAWLSPTLRAVQGEAPLQQPCLPSGSNALRIRTVASQGICPKRCHKPHRGQDQQGVCYRACHKVRYWMLCISLWGSLWVPAHHIAKKCRNLWSRKDVSRVWCRALHQAVIFGRRHHWYLLISIDHYCFRLLSG